MTIGGESSAVEIEVEATDIETGAIVPLSAANESGTGRAVGETRAPVSVTEGVLVETIVDESLTDRLVSVSSAMVCATVRVESWTVLVESETELAVRETMALGCATKELDSVSSQVVFATAGSVGVSVAIRRRNVAK